jgi:head-tail adaptor
MTRIQELRDRVVLLKRRVVEEEDGSFKEHWTEGDSVWAQIIPCVTRETLGEEWNTLTPSHAKYKVMMRFRHGRFMRIKWDEKILALLCPPLIDQRRKWMTCFMYAVGEDND